MFPSIIGILVLWLVIHVAHSLVHRRQISSILPTQHNLRRSKATVTLKSLHLKVQTTSFNHLHDILTTRLQKNGYRTILESFYDLGTLICAFGMMVAIGLLAWTFIGLIQDLRHQNVPRLFTKRDLSDDEQILVKPILPGITVPLNSLPVIFMALLLSQFIHELGHAVAAALSSIPILSAGFSITAVLPSAFVILPSAALNRLNKKQQARIISAGAWHNILFWLFIMFLNNAIMWIGYRNVGSFGRAVASVEQKSALDGFIPQGAMVTKLDDVSLVGDTDIWTWYLTSAELEADTGKGMGWCVSKRAFLESQDECCIRHVESKSNSTSLLACFASSDQQRCMDPLPILTRPGMARRCDSNGDCVSGQAEGVCVHPSLSSQLLRISVREELDEPIKETILLWTGPRIEVWQQVQVSSFLPRLFILPFWLPRLLDSVCGYFSSITLSLFLFNLLPLPYLDGGEFLAVLLDWAADRQGRNYMEAEIYELSGLEEGSANVGHYRTSRRWITTIEKTVKLCCVSMVAGCAIMGLGKVVIK